MKCAIYARKSTDKQSEMSTPIQVERCRAYAEEQGWTVVDVVEDKGLSGASRWARKKFLELMKRVDDWDVLLCWDFTRLARNEEDQGWVANELEEVEKDAIAVRDKRSIHDDAARYESVSSASFLRKLRLDTHRGLLWRAENGYEVGGTPYGYRSEPLPGAPPSRDRSQLRRRVVDEIQAAVVRRIFELYAAGATTREITHRFNREGVAPPTPRSHKRASPSWSPNAVRKVLQNSCYHGEFVWNQNRYKKNRRTGKRHRTPRPASEVVRLPRPDLRIVSEELWDAVQAEFQRRAEPYTRSLDGRRFALGEKRPTVRTGRRRTLLADFLACAECGGSFTRPSSESKLLCRNAYGRGQCSSTLRVSQPKLEDVVIDALRGVVLSEENVDHLISRTIAGIEAEMGGRGREADRIRLGEIDAELGNLVRLAAKVGDGDEITGEITRLRAERSTLNARLESALRAPDPEQLRRMILDHTQRLGEALRGALEEGRATLRALLEGRRMEVGPDAEHGFQVSGLFSVPLTPRQEEVTGSCGERGMGCESRSSERVGTRVSSCCGSSSVTLRRSSLP